jgi:DNA polymerase III gamma/tau subunit
MVDFAKLRRRSTAIAADPDMQADYAADNKQDEPLHVKYRPKVLKDVWGQDAVTKSLASVLSSKNPGHAYLFTGPAGTGKTTLARILAKNFGCDPANILEVDAATNNGIEAMRDVTSALRYHGFGASPNRGIIIDECHALSKQAWQSLLKTVEEPPPHVYIFFCTTETGKVPETIGTRCHTYNLKPLRYSDLIDLVEAVDREESLGVPSKIHDMVAKAAQGSARRALVMLSMVRSCKTTEEAEPLLEVAEDNKDVIDLCRLMVGGKLTWKAAVDTLKRIPDMNAESVRIVAVNYLASCLKAAKSDNDAIRLLDMLNAFSKPFPPTDKDAPLLLALGNIIFPPN